jgi:hypothetical protein
MTTRDDNRVRRRCSADMRVAPLLGRRRTVSAQHAAHRHRGGGLPPVRTSVLRSLFPPGCRQAHTCRPAEAGTYEKTRGPNLSPAGWVLTQAERLHKTACEFRVREEDRRVGASASPYHLHTVSTWSASGRRQSTDCAAMAPRAQVPVQGSASTPYSRMYSNRSAQPLAYTTVGSACELPRLPDPRARR